MASLLYWLSIHQSSLQSFCLEILSIPTHLGDKKAISILPNWQEDDVFVRWFTRPDWWLADNGRHYIALYICWAVALLRTNMTGNIRE